MKEKNKKPRELLLYFTPVYNMLIQNWFLNAIERNLAILFSSCPDGVCTWSREQLKRYCECGPYHLERAIRRLKFLHIIDVDKGGWRQSNPPRRESNTYIFQSDPYRWRVTKELQERIAAETLKVGKELRPFEHKPFENQLGFEIAFQKSVPAYANGKKGRRKQIQALQAVKEPAEVQWPTDNDQRWIIKSQKIVSDGVRFSYLAREFYRYSDDINFSRENPDHGFSSHQLTYFERLYTVFTDKRRRLRDEDDIETFNKISQWLNENKSNSEISHELGRLDQKQKGGTGHGSN